MNNSTHYTLTIYIPLWPASKQTGELKLVLYLINYYLICECRVRLKLA